MAAKNKSNEIKITRVYDAPVKTVWDAWTDPEQVAQWWGPRGFTLTTHSKDLRVGGHWRYTMHGPDGTDFENTTKYFEVEKYSRLVYDHGGNDVEVEFIGETMDPYRRKPWNLHAVWDSGILEVGDRDARHYAERLNVWLNTQPEGAFQNGSVVDWAMESHDIARDHVYTLPDDRKLGEGYYRANAPVVDQQLAKAGVRLAKLLNDALGKK